AGVVYTAHVAALSSAIPPQEIASMLPADIIAEITTNLAGLHLESNTTAQILAAVFAPLLRSSGSRDPDPVPKRRHKRAGRPRRKAKRQAPRQKYTRAPTEARERARAALKANPGLSLTRVAKAAGVSRSTVVNARGDLAAEGHKPTPKPAKPPDERRQRAQRFLRDELAHGPKRVSDVEEAATKAH